MGTIILPISLDKKNIYFRNDRVEETKEALETYIEDEKKMQTSEFAKKVLLANEVQSNNSVEGYYDDINKIREIVKKKRKYQKSSEEDKLRILNLYAGYKYALNCKKIDDNNLKELYSILSKGLLSEEEMNNMGEFYRNAPVYIYYSSDMTKEPDTGVDTRALKEKMDLLFNFIENYSLGDSNTDEYIKSQILHFYFVYIHPYFDINGRTARTTSIWHLLNNKAYPYVIFNRGIQINKSEYYKVIREVKKYNNITYFINYMLNTVLVELEKEHAMQSIADTCNEKLTGTDYQTLHYLLSMNGLTTVSDFVNMYNKHNYKKSAKTIHEEMILPLEEKNIIVPGRITNGHFGKDSNNYILGINKSYVDDNPLKVKDINILKKGNI